MPKYTHEKIIKIAGQLYELSDKDPLWQKMDLTYDHQYCFKDYTLENIYRDAGIAQKWAKMQPNFNKIVKLLKSYV